MDTYKTITHESESIYKEKGSKFIGFAIPVENEDSIAAALEKIKALHPKASHHCYAYKLRSEKTLSRANDDGEPSNSAGKPILGQLDRLDLLNVLIVVVRYFGGTKLGVGGLQTAYKGAAAMALEDNTIIEKEIAVFFTIQFPYDKQGIVNHLIKNVEGEILEKSFNTACAYHCKIPKGNQQQFIDKIGRERFIDLLKEK